MDRRRSSLFLPQSAKASVRSLQPPLPRRPSHQTFSPVLGGSHAPPPPLPQSSTPPLPSSRSLSGAGVHLFELSMMDGFQRRRSSLSSSQARRRSTSSGIPPPLPPTVSQPAGEAFVQHTAGAEEQEEIAEPIQKFRAQLKTRLQAAESWAAGAGTTELADLFQDMLACCPSNVHCRTLISLSLDIPASSPEGDRERLARLLASLQSQGPCMCIRSQPSALGDGSLVNMCVPAFFRCFLAVGGGRLLEVILESDPDGELRALALRCLVALQGAVRFADMCTGQLEHILPPRQLRYGTFGHFEWVSGRMLNPVRPGLRGSGPFQFSVEPRLPVGVHLQKETGELWGTPQSPSQLTQYTIRAKNSAGWTECDVRIRIVRSGASPGSVNVADSLRRYAERAQDSVSEEEVTAMFQLLWCEESTPPTAAADEDGEEGVSSGSRPVSGGVSAFSKVVHPDGIAVLPVICDVLLRAPVSVVKSCLQHFVILLRDSRNLAAISLDFQWQKWVIALLLRLFTPSVSDDTSSEAFVLGLLVSTELHFYILSTHPQVKEKPKYNILKQTGALVEKYWGWNPQTVFVFRQIVVSVLHRIARSARNFTHNFDFPEIDPPVGWNNFLCTLAVVDELLFVRGLLEALQSPRNRSPDGEGSPSLLLSGGGDGGVGDGEEERATGWLWSSLNMVNTAIMAIHALKISLYSSPRHLSLEDLVCVSRLEDQLRDCSGGLLVPTDDSNLSPTRSSLSMTPSTAAQESSTALEKNVKRRGRQAFDFYLKARSLLMSIITQREQGKSYSQALAQLTSLEGKANWKLRSRLSSPSLLLSEEEHPRGWEEKEEEEGEGEKHRNLTWNLTVTVVSGLGLVSKDSNGLSDPFVRLALLDHSGQVLWKGVTKVKPKTLDPVWEESFQLPPLSPEELGSKLLSAEIWDKGRLGKNEFMGRLVLSVSRIRTLQLEQIRGSPAAAAAAGSPEQTQFNQDPILMRDLALHPRSENPQDEVSGSLTLSFVYYPVREEVPKAIKNSVLQGPRSRRPSFLASMLGQRKSKAASSPPLVAGPRPPSDPPPLGVLQIQPRAKTVNPLEPVPDNPPNE